MVISNEEIRINRKIDLLYKNLEHVSAAYFAAEGVYPSWEAAFALIVGQIFIAYYGQHVCPSQQFLLAVFGVVLSSIWFIIVSLNLQYAIHIEREARRLQDMLDDEIKKNGSANQLEFIRPWIWEKKDWTLGDIFWGVRPKARHVSKGVWFAVIIKSTWFYRRVLPFFLCLFWIYVWNSCALIPIVLIIAVLFYNFKPKLDLPLVHEEVNAKSWSQVRK